MSDIDMDAADDTRMEEEEEHHDEVAQPEAGGSKPSRAKKARQSLAERSPGTTVLPFARVQKIIRADRDVQNVSKEAIFLISIATEQFVKRLTDQAYVKARLEKRKLMTMKDLSTAVKQNPEFSFLAEIIPQTVPLSVALAARQRQDAGAIPDFEEATLAEILPAGPIHVSTNPQYPDTIVRPAPTTHAKKSKKAMEASAAAAAAAAAASALDSNNANVRKSARKKPRKSGAGQDEPAEQASPTKPKSNGALAHALGENAPPEDAAEANHGGAEDEDDEMDEDES